MSIKRSIWKTEKKVHGETTKLGMHVHTSQEKINLRKEFGGNQKFRVLLFFFFLVC